VLQGTLVSIGGRMADTLIKEFLLSKLTSNTKF